APARPGAPLGRQGTAGSGNAGRRRVSRQRGPAQEPGALAGPAGAAPVELPGRLARLEPGRPLAGLPRLRRRLAERARVRRFAELARVRRRSPSAEETDVEDPPGDALGLHARILSGGPEEEVPQIDSAFVLVVGMAQDERRRPGDVR